MIQSSRLENYSGRWRYELLISDQKKPTTKQQDCSHAKPQRTFKRGVGGAHSSHDGMKTNDPWRAADGRSWENIKVISMTIIHLELHGAQRHCHRKRLSETFECLQRRTERRGQGSERRPMNIQEEESVLLSVHAHPQTDFLHSKALLFIRNSAQNRYRL